MSSDQFHSIYDSQCHVTSNDYSFNQWPLPNTNSLIRSLGFVTPLYFTALYKEKRVGADPDLYIYFQIAFAILTEEPHSTWNW